ncbi:hypothetical protein HAX54_013961, partial [Datura stramonium]|nr:hypothetical protein [Datura stramonium]
LPTYHPKYNERTGDARDGRSQDMGYKQRKIGHSAYNVMSDEWSRSQIQPQMGQSNYQQGPVHTQTIIDTSVETSHTVIPPPRFTQEQYD